MLDVNHFPHIDWKDLGGEAGSYTAGVFSAFIDRRHVAQLLLCFHLEGSEGVGEVTAEGVISDFLLHTYREGVTILFFALIVSGTLRCLWEFLLERLG